MRFVVGASSFNVVLNACITSVKMPSCMHELMISSSCMVWDMSFNHQRRHLARNWTEYGIGRALHNSPCQLDWNQQLQQQAKTTMFKQRMHLVVTSVTQYVVAVVAASISLIHCVESLSRSNEMNIACCSRVCAC